MLQFLPRTIPHALPPPSGEDEGKRVLIKGFVFDEAAKERHQMNMTQLYSHIQGPLKLSLTKAELDMQTEKSERFRHFYEQSVVNNNFSVWMSNLDQHQRWTDHQMQTAWAEHEKKHNWLVKLVEERTLKLEQQMGKVCTYASEYDLEKELQAHVQTLEYNVQLKVLEQVRLELHEIKAEAQTAFEVKEAMYGDITKFRLETSQMDQKLHMMLAKPLSKLDSVETKLMDFKGYVSSELKELKSARKADHEIIHALDIAFPNLKKDVGRINNHMTSLGKTAAAGIEIANKALANSEKALTAANENKSAIKEGENATEELKGDVEELKGDHADLSMSHANLSDRTTANESALEKEVSLGVRRTLRINSQQEQLDAVKLQAAETINSQQE